MKSRTLTSLALAAGMLFGMQAVQANQALAQSKNCMACHSIDKKLVGPSYKDVSAKYKGKGMEAKLAAKIKSGGTGAWGAVPMPPNNVSDAEATTLAKWVLSQ